MQAMTDGILQSSPSQLEAEGWRRMYLQPGSVLWQQGDVAEGLCIVAAGCLSVESPADTQQASRGQGIGVASAFFRNAQHKNTVTALEPSEVWMLPEACLLTLRSPTSTTYASLLTSALASQVNQLNQLTRTAGTYIPKHLEPLDVYPQDISTPRWKSVFSTPQSPTPVEETLRTVPVFDEAPQEILDEVAGAMRPLIVSDGERVFTQGASVRDLMIITSGRMTVDWGAGQGKSYRLTTIEPGTVFGMIPFLTGNPVRASATAQGQVTLWLLGPASAARLSGEANLTLRECLLSALRTQTTRVAASFTRLNTEQGREDFDVLLSSVVGLRGWKAGHPGLAPSLSSLPAPSEPSAVASEKATLLRTIRQSVIGGDLALPTPFGTRRVIYADYTASGRNLTFIEDFIRKEVMPLYANTHTEASESGRQTTRFREEARALVARSVGADEDYSVLFVGSGATGAINKLIDIMNLRLPPDLNARYNLEAAIPPEERPVVFHGPYEHHSNILPWRHSLAEVVVIGLDGDGGIDAEQLEKELIRFQHRPLRIGSFSAASNVTGIATDVDVVTTLLHQHGALSFWDYAAAGPYVAIEMKPTDKCELSYKDALFISPHKFIGGPGTPGVLVVRNDLVQNTVPTQPGGGTVDFVTGGDTLYSDSITHREEAGTPAIQESIRCGLVFHLKDQVGAATIHHHERDFVRRAIASWSQNPNIRILGNPKANRLSIISFMVRHGSRFLHHNFIIVLLNDLFGIQARGGCSCAGPYGAALLGLNEEMGESYMCLAKLGWSSLKPGWARVNFNYFISETEFQYIISAVHLIAVYGYALMPRYDFDSRDGLWIYRHHQKRETMQLTSLKFDGGIASWTSAHDTLPESALEAHLNDARQILQDALHSVPPRLPVPELIEDYERMRWFPLSYEIAAYLRHRNEEHSGHPVDAEIDPIATIRETYQAAQGGEGPIIEALRRTFKIGPAEDNDED